MCRDKELDLRWTVFPLHPETPAAGRSLEELFGGRLDVPEAMARLKGIALQLGLPFGDRTHTYNSRAAQELGKWAEQQGRGAAFRDSVYRAYFGAGRNIAEPDVLIDLCGSIGLAEEEARTVLARKTFAAAVDSDWRRAVRYGVRSVPTRIYRNRMLVGYRPKSELIELIERL